VIRVVWDGAAYHRSALVAIPVEALWRWLREDVTDNYCHQSADELRGRVRELEQRINDDPIALVERRWVKDELDPDEEKLRSRGRRGFARRDGRKY
jgi:hypothetical protein